MVVSVLSAFKKLIATGFLKGPILSFCLFEIFAVLKRLNLCFMSQS